MELSKLIELIKHKGIYDIHINSWNNNCEVWSHKGIRKYPFDTEAELIAFLKGVYYTQVDMQL